MSQLNVEIKARCEDPDAVRRVLRDRAADFKGVDRQTDTYFNVPKGRLKLREGNIEHSLIHYDRDDTAGPKVSAVTLYHPQRDSTLKEVLSRSLGTLVVVKKRREIYFIDNVKFHIDALDGLGSFVEIEAIDATGETGREELHKQCRAYMEAFEISSHDLVERSYSDMVLDLARRS